METTIIERAVTVALHDGASSINADAAASLLRVIAALRQERDALQAWKDAAPVAALQRYHRHMTRTQYGDIDAIQAWLVTLDGAA